MIYSFPALIFFLSTSDKIFYKMSLESILNSVLNESKYKIQNDWDFSINIDTRKQILGVEIAYKVCFAKPLIFSQET